MSYYHRLYNSAKAFKYRQTDSTLVPAASKVVCVGRNYLDHIKELGNAPSEKPVLFMKPSTALCDVENPIKLPRDLGACHNELELAFLIDAKLKNANKEECSDAVAGVGLSLDLTLRDVQDELKKAGKPWERAKAFDASCPISGFVPLNGYHDDAFTFSLHINQVLKQAGDSKMMLHALIPLLQEITAHFTLLPGDVVLTGTPKGVGPLHEGDSLRLTLDNHFTVSTTVCA
ncbi:fumarylacetoacetate hydrolase family protein [Ningiella sp. W23]|uniref:fumarylacetoacetate hydrolase family protein n=1 Tax=Ningiella sp. W23 TaxID=3023715 RepID=UPI0037583BAF